MIKIIPPVYYKIRKSPSQRLLLKESWNKSDKSEFFFKNTRFSFQYEIVFLLISCLIIFSHQRTIPRVFLRVILLLWKRGFIHSIYLDCLHQTELPLYYFVIESPYDSSYSDGVTPWRFYSRGFSENKNQALSKCIGECLERTPMLYYRESDLIKGNYESLKNSEKNFINPKDFYVFNESQQKMFNQFEDSLETSDFLWAETECLNGQSEDVSLIPAQLVFWNYKRNEELFLRESGTHGAAGFFSLAGASVKAICEVAGRDGFFSAWYQPKVHADQINFDRNLPPKIKNLISRIKDKGFDVEIVDVTSKKIVTPSFACFLFRRDQQISNVSMGHACGLSVEDAIRGSIEEALSMYHWLGNTQKQNLNEYSQTDFNSYKHFNDVDRLNYWAIHGNRQKLDWFISKGRHISYSECLEKYKVYDELSCLSDELQLETIMQLNGRLTFYRYIFDSAALKQIGFYSVKIVVPELLPMFHNMRYFPAAKIPDIKKESGEVPHLFP